MSLTPITHNEHQKQEQSIKNGRSQRNKVMRFRTTAVILGISKIKRDMAVLSKTKKKETGIEPVEEYSRF